MAVVRVDDSWQAKWDAFVTVTATDGGLLQSWQWGVYQKELGHKIFRLVVLDGSGELVGVALVVHHELPFEYSYLYVPRGPVMNGDAGVLAELLAECKTIAEEEKSFMLRLDPAWMVGYEHLLVSTGLRKCDTEVQPKCTVVVDIHESLETVLNQMKQKTRYNIHLAERRGVTVSMNSEPTAIEYFWQLTRQTAERNDFKPHPKEHYKKLLDIFGPDQGLVVFVAEYQGKVIGTIMVAFFGTTAVYLHGASADTYRDVMAAYLLQWVAMQEANRRGCWWYDFGGVNSQTFQNKKWEGITRFKTGFSTLAPREYVGCFEQIYNPIVFAVYSFVKQIRD
jgi:lipid II:glycine glycyltransferase (peptidoglycan interpeptide bridge formation enzyme)